MHIIFPTSGAFQNIEKYSLASLIYSQTCNICSGSTGFSAESTWTPICHMHAWQRVLDPNCSCNCTIAPGVAQLQLMFTQMPRQSLPCNTNQVSFDAKILHTLSSTQQTFIQHKNFPQNIGHMSNPPPATPDNLPTTGLDTILYHSAYLTTPNPWGGVRRSWKETEALTKVEIVSKNSLGKTFNYITLMWCTP